MGSGLPRLDEGRLAACKMSRYILATGKLPQPATGKVRPMELRQLAEERLGLTLDTGAQHMRLFVREKEFYIKILTIGGPISLQQIITVGVNMMDTVMLGQLNETALSASAAATQVHSLFQFMTMGMGMGASVLIARYWGAGELSSLRKALTLMYRSCLLISLAFTLVVGLFPAQVLSLLTPYPEVVAEGMRYLRWALPCFFLFGMSTVTTIVLRNLKQMHIPLYVSVGAFFINIFFNWVFIFGKLGAPAMGVAGAALGTLISRCFEFSAICGYFFLIEKGTRYRVRDILSPCKNLTGEFLRISLPVMVSDTLLGLGTSVTMSVAGHISDIFVSAYTITQVTQQITTVFTAALGQSAVIITGNTLGKGDPERAQQQGITFTVLGFVLGTLCGAVIVLISPLIVGSYNILPETHAVALELMRAVGIITIFMTPANILTKGVLRGGGDTRFLMLADVVFLWAMSVPLGYLAGLVWCWPPFWVFFCLRLDHVIKAVWCVFRLKSGKWIKKIRTNSETV